MKILMVPGPFFTKRRIYNSISSADRPDPAKVEEVMQALAVESLGSVVKIRRGVIFYKSFPEQKLYMESNHPKKAEYQALQLAQPVPE